MLEKSLVRDVSQFSANQTFLFFINIQHLIKEIHKIELPSRSDSTPSTTKYVVKLTKEAARKLFIAANFTCVISYATAPFITKRPFSSTRLKMITRASTLRRRRTTTTISSMTPTFRRRWATTTISCRVIWANRRRKCFKKSQDLKNNM